MGSVCVTDGHSGYTNTRPFALQDIRRRADLALGQTDTRRVKGKLQVVGHNVGGAPACGGMVEVLRGGQVAARKPFPPPPKPPTTSTTAKPPSPSTTSPPPKTSESASPPNGPSRRSRW